jgi:hypothetical protein
VNVTAIMHESSIASELPQLLVWLKSVGFAPVMAMLLIASAAVPTFSSLMFCAVAVVPTVVFANVSAEGVSEGWGANGVLPVPLSATVCGEPVALSATESVAAKLAAEAGVNVTEMEQLAFAASELPQVLVWAKSVGLVPVIEIPEIVNAALPVFLSMTVCAGDVVPVLVVKLSELGESETAGAAAAVPVPLKVTVCGDPVALSATESVAAKLAAEAGVNVTEMEQLAFAASEFPQVLV